MSSEGMRLFLFILLELTRYISAAEITFPDHVTVDLLSHALFQCSISLTTEETGIPHGIRWKKDNLQIASSDKYNLLSSSEASSSITQHLQVINVVESDLGTYECIFLQNDIETNVTASARLYIKDYVPTPQCSSLEGTLVSPNDQVSLYCFSDPSDPTIQMAWSTTSEGTQLASSSQIGNNFVSLTYALTVPNYNAEQRVSYTCKTFNAISFNTCNISLFVTIPVQLSIRQSPEPVTVNEDVVFVCFILEGSTATSASWLFQSSGINHDIDGSKLTIYDVQSTYDGLVLTCIVNTPDGKEWRKETTLYVTSLMTTPMKQTTKSTTIADSIHTTKETTTVTTTSMTTTNSHVQEITSNTMNDKTTSTDSKQSITPTVPDNTITITDIDSKQSVSPLNQKEDESSITMIIIIIIAVSSSIFLIIIIGIVICCKCRSQPHSSELDISSRIEYYKNVEMENEIKRDRSVNDHEFVFTPNNLNEPYGVYNEFAGETENDEIYYKDDGWSPPTSTPQTTTL